MTGGTLSDATVPEIWKIVFRDTIEEDFIVPNGFELVDINENNFRNYVSRISHLIEGNEEIGGLMELGRLI